MNSYVVYEALAVGFKEGLKIGIVSLVFYPYLVLHDRKELLKPFAFGVIIALLASCFVSLLPREIISKDIIGNVVLMSFALFLISSVGALFDASGIGLFEPFKRFFRGNTASVVVFILPLLIFLPDFAGTFLFLREISIMKEQVFITYSSAVVGFLFALALFFILNKYLKPLWIGRFFDLPQLLLFIAIVKLAAGGTKGIAEISLISSVQRGLMKFSHDVIHQTFVLLMVPDHPLLKTTVWNFIGIFFGSNLASIESLLILLFSPLIFLYYSLLKPLPDPQAPTGAEKRKIKYLMLSDRRKKALPVLTFIAIISFLWFTRSGEEVSRLYNPKPKPVVEDKGLVMIPVNDPTMDLRDGALHKFSLNYQGREMRILIIKRPDNMLSVCLDACEICPPEGYGQRGDHVVCIYCNTPIPVNTLGQPGGCNPIPLTSSIDDRFIKVEIGEILKKWEYVKSGKSKGVIK